MSLRPPSARTSSVPGTGLGRSHGTSSAAAFDRWFRYPAGFASDYVDLLLDQLGDGNGTVVDCFAGSGVTGTAARARGRNFFGIEAHPMVAELAQLKLTSAVTGTQVRLLQHRVLTRARALRDEGDICLNEPELVSRSFDESTLVDLVALREAVRSHLGEPGALHLKWALLGTLRDVASVKVGWPYQRPGIGRKPRFVDVLSRFVTRSTFMAEDIDGSRSGSARAQVVVGDSRDPAVWAKAESTSSACIASPPYLNNFDYGDATRLELYFWGDVTTWGQMRSEVWGDMLTATTQQSSVKEMRAALSQVEQMATSTANEIVGLVHLMTETKNRRERRSKEYDQVAPAYFLAMSQVLANLHGHLNDGADVLWLIGDSAPYGVYVDTPRLIAGLATDIGFEAISDVTLRERGQRWASNTDRHDVQLHERLVTLKKRN